MAPGEGPCERPFNAPGGGDRPRLNRRQYIALMTATIIGSAVAFVDGSIVSVGLPAIRDDLGASLAQMQWIVNGYALMLAAFILPGGAAGDAFGRRRVFLLGVAVHTLASIWCALAHSPSELIAARVVAGAGGALMIPASLALITVNIPKEERGAAIGLWAAAGAAATAAGPIFGGTLIDTLGWRAAMVLTVPFGVLTIAVAWAGVPESRADARSMDWTGGMLACIALGSIAFALTSLTAEPGPWVVAVAGLVGIAFAGSNGLTFLLYGALSAALFFLPIALIDAHGYSATAAGLALLPFTLVIAALSRFAGGLVDRFGSRLPLTVGPSLTGFGFALMGYAAYSGDFWLAVLPAMLVMGAGMGLTAAPLSTTVMNAVDERQAGVASGINNAVARTAGLIFVAAFGIVAQAGFVLAGANGRFGEPLSGSEAYRAGIVAGFAAVAAGCALFAFAAGLVGFLSLKSAPPGE